MGTAVRTRRKGVKLDSVFAEACGEAWDGARGVGGRRTGVDDEDEVVAACLRACVRVAAERRACLAEANIGR